MQSNPMLLMSPRLSDFQCWQAMKCFHASKLVWQPGTWLACSSTFFLAYFEVAFGEEMKWKITDLSGAVACTCGLS
jgi:hypothetical protein